MAPVGPLFDRVARRVLAAGHLAGPAVLGRIQDRDGYHNTMRKKGKQRQIDANRAKFSIFSRKHVADKSLPSAFKTGLIPMMVFWFVVMGLLYMLMTHYLKPKQIKISANGDLIIPRSHDGHFYTLGTINGQQVTFLVDTGASLVTVSEVFAKKAHISGGVAATFHTAKGSMPGGIVDGLTVTMGPLVATNIKLGVGLAGRNENDGLLGHSFLSKFDIKLEKNQMILRAR